MTNDFIYYCSKEELLANTKIPMRVVESMDAVNKEIARIMADTIIKNNGKQTVIICPVGPIGQYPYFVDIVNSENISLKNCIFINMDEYLDENDEYLSIDNKLSFRKTMNDLLYSKIKPELVMPEENRLFPIPGKEKEMDELFESFEKVDLCLTGVGINGHLAFNEPSEPDDDITDEQYAEIGTRCLDISRETITRNGSGKMMGALDIFPRRCITLGMKQLLKAEVFKVYLYLDWQWGIMRKAALHDVTRFAPVTYLQNHKNAEMIITDELLDAQL